MKKEDQTPELIEKLYFLTRTWVRKEWRNYFYQYDGDIEDLSSDYFLSFMTAKSRKEGEEKTFLDHFDPTVRSLEGFTHVCVVRKLIDSSRVRSHQYGKCDLISISNMIDADGNGSEEREIQDPVWDELSTLPDEMFDDKTFDWNDIRGIKQKFYALSERKQEKIKEMAAEKDADLSPEFKEMFTEVVTREREKKIVQSLKRKRIPVAAMSVEQLTKETKQVASELSKPVLVATTKVSAGNVMRRAHVIAKSITTGTYRDRLSVGMKQAWAEAKGILIPALSHVKVSSEKKQEYALVEV